MAKYYGAAAEYNQSGGFRFDRRMTMFIIMGLLLLSLMTAVFMVITSINNGPRNDLATLLLRTQRLQQFTADQQKGIKNGDLAKINSDAGLLLSSDATSLRKQLSTLYGPFEYTDEMIAAETDATSKKKLADASLLNRFDTVYISLLRDKIAATMRLAQKTGQSNSSASLKAVIETEVANLTTIDGHLAKLNP